jgi:hypothetical protein
VQSGSPVKESSYLNRETSMDELEEKENKENKAGDAKLDSVSPPPTKDGIPIRR